MRLTSTLIAVLVCMALPAKSQSLVGTWNCEEISREAHVKSSFIEFRADGGYESQVQASFRLGEAIIRFDILMVGMWSLEGTRLDWIPDKFKVTRLFFGNKDMTHSRSAEDLLTLLKRESLSQGDVPAEIQFKSLDRMKMTDEFLQMDCIRKGLALHG